MEELAKIITAITEVMDTDRWGILFGRNEQCKRARSFLCYIALKDMYGMSGNLTEMIGKSRSQCAFMAAQCEEDISDNVDSLILMNKVRQKLNKAPVMIQKIEEAKKKRERLESEQTTLRSITNSKTIFGITYTASDLSKIKDAVESAVEFMNTYCKVGIPADGRLTRSRY